MSLQVCRLSCHHHLLQYLLLYLEGFTVVPLRTLHRSAMLTKSNYEQGEEKKRKMFLAKSHSHEATPPELSGILNRVQGQSMSQSSP